MQYQCPLNYTKVENNISRIISFLFAFCIFIYTWSAALFIVYVLLADLLIRLYWKKEFSPFYRMALFIKNLFSLETVWYDGGAKKLANHFGLFFLLFFLVARYAELSEFSFYAGITFLLCLLLDAFFNFCIGCKIYYLYKQVSKIF